MRNRDYRPDELDENGIPKMPEWLSSWSWWLRLLALAIGLVAVRYFMNGGSFV
jgi:hypothetical protein